MYPRRIVCLTEETTETLYLLGEGDRVVGVSGYTVRPPAARQKPKVSSFLHARYEKIEALEPDLILPSRTCRPTSRPSSSSGATPSSPSTSARWPRFSR
jgi:ABC-type hemin transport system substrate-binding protein